MEELVDKAVDISELIIVTEKDPIDGKMVTGPKFQVNKHIWYQRHYSSERRKDKLSVERTNHYTSARWMGGINTEHTEVIQIDFDKSTQVYTVGIGHRLTRSHKDIHKCTYEEALAHIVAAMKE
jgi:hypothetical protein